MKKSKESESKVVRCFCPYCEKELVISTLPYCQACAITIFYWPECQKPLPRDNEVCPHCGANIRAEDS